ncbi:MAG: Smr/MutS family protein [Rickettsiales bacterium]
MNRRDLDKEERELWKQIVSNTKPLGKIKKKIFTHIPDKKNPPCNKIHASSIIVKDDNIFNSNMYELVNLVSNKQQIKNVKKLNDYSGIDKNTLQRFRKGNMIIDARIDLHGLTGELAYNRLSLFINEQIEKRSRFLLIITGKGKGILSGVMPDWLENIDLGDNILAIDKAQPKHGGHGAYYILLRRQRKY